MLFAIVVLSWTYTIFAGRVVSKRYLSTLDLSEYQVEPKSNLFADVGEVGKKKVGEDTYVGGAQDDLGAKKNDRRGGEG